MKRAAADRMGRASLNALRKTFCLLISILMLMGPSTQAFAQALKPPTRPAANAPPHPTANAPTRRPPNSPAHRLANAPKTNDPASDGLRLDFDNVDITVVIDTIAKYTGKNFIYDEKVRGAVTIVSPTAISLDQAYAVLESMLQVKGFTTVEGPGGIVKIIPLAEAKQSSINTAIGRKAATRDRFVTRLIPMRFIGAASIVETLKPLISKDASLVAYEPTNTVIMTDAEANIKRVLSILESIDVETFREQLTVIKIEHADAGMLAEQLLEIYDTESTTSGRPKPKASTSRSRRRSPAAQLAASGGAGGDQSRVRVITDARTNSLIILASRSKLADIRSLVEQLDVPVTGGGRIHVYYLKHADSEKLAETLNTLISAVPGASSGGPGSKAGSAAANVAALRAAVTELEGGVSVTADAATNSLVIRASQEGFRTISQVINQLDIYRPQVLVEALLLEVDITDSKDLGFNGLATIDHGATQYGIATLTGGASLAGTPVADLLAGTVAPSLPSFIGNVINTSDSGSLIQGIVSASASEKGTNIVSSPSILTSDNEEAEILIGNNIPIVTSRFDNNSNTSAEVNTSTVSVEREDIGITLRVTPQISEGDQVRLEIFQEITEVNDTLTEQVAGNADQSQIGVALSNRKIENTVVVADGSTVVIGGLISDKYDDNENKVPWLGDIPLLGWLFKTRRDGIRKINLIMFLTPHIIRDGDDFERVSTYKREEFRQRSLKADDLRKEKDAPGNRAYADQHWDEKNPIRGRLKGVEQRYPVENAKALEQQRADDAAAEAAEFERIAEELERDAADAAVAESSLFTVIAGIYPSEDKAIEVLTLLVEDGFDGDLITAESEGSLLYRVHIGPYERLGDADAAAATIRERHELAASVLVGRQEAQ